MPCHFTVVRLTDILSSSCLSLFSAAPSRCRYANAAKRRAAKKTRILNIHNIFMKYTILFFFLHRRSQRRASMPYSFFLDPSVHPPAALTLRCAVWGLWFNNVCLRMRVRGPAHGMQGVLDKIEIQRFCLSHAPGRL
jgi:hypothetical protein